jgi:hypothetical protein
MSFGALEGAPICAKTSTRWTAHGWAACTRRSKGRFPPTVSKITNCGPPAWARRGHWVSVICAVESEELFRAVDYRRVEHHTAPALVATLRSSAQVLRMECSDHAGTGAQVERNTHPFLKSAKNIVRYLVVLSSDDDAAERTLRTVNVERHIEVGQEDPEAVEVLAEIRDRFSERTLWQGSLLKHPLMNLLHHGAGACLANLEPFVRRLSFDVAQCGRARR